MNYLGFSNMTYEESRKTYPIIDPGASAFIELESIPAVPEEPEPEPEKKKFPWWILLLIAGSYYLSNK